MLLRLLFDNGQVAWKPQSCTPLWTLLAYITLPGRFVFLPYPFLFFLRACALVLP